MVVMGDGFERVYVVSSTTSYNYATAPVAEIAGPTPREVLTLITCTGSFDRASRNYDRRLVVRADPAS